MSELKAYRIKGVTLGDFADVYIKSEADKVIAEKDKEIAELKADYNEVCGRLQTANLIKDEQLAATRHNKYKRCVAMVYVEWLKQMNLCNYPENILYRRAVRRERKWKELAKKFKEAK